MTCTSINTSNRDDTTSSCSVTLRRAAGRWAHARSPLPKLLAHVGVPERLWSDTFNEVARIEELACRLEKSMKLWETVNLTMRVLQVAFPVVLLFLVLLTATHHLGLLFKLAAVLALVLYCGFPTSC